MWEETCFARSWMGQWSGITPHKGEHHQIQHLMAAEGHRMKNTDCQRSEWVLKGARKRFCPSIYHKPFNPPVCPNPVQQDMLLARSKFISFSHQNIFALWEQNTFHREFLWLLWGCSRRKFHSVYQRCQMLAQTPQRKHLKRGRTFTCHSPSQACATLSPSE